MNVAVAAARLGTPAAFVGRVSTDEYGEAIWRHLHAVNLKAAERGPEPTARAIIEYVPQLRFRFEGDGTADLFLEKADLSVLGGGPHIVHGGTLGMFRGQTAEVLAQLAESHRGLVSLDPNVRPLIIDDRDRWMQYHDRWVTHTDVYRGSDEDFDWIWPGRDSESIAEELLASGVQAVVLTQGPDGAKSFTSAGMTQVGAKPVDVVDTVGAGDTFVAATLVALGDSLHLEQLDWEEILTFAVTAAGITCSRAGANPPTRDEVGFHS